MKVNEWLVSSMQLVFRVHRQAAVAVGVRQLPEKILAQMQLLVILITPCQTASVAMKRSSEMRCYQTNCSEEELAASSGLRLPLVTVWHSLLLLLVYRS